MMISYSLKKKRKIGENAFEFLSIIDHQRNAFRREKIQVLNK